MTHIQTYRRDLDDLRRIAGSDNEVLRISLADDTASFKPCAREENDQAVCKIRRHSNMDAGIQSQGCEATNLRQVLP